MIVVSFFCFHESYGPWILRRRAENLRRETGNNQYYTESERVGLVDGEKSTSTILTRALTRPLRLLIFHPIIQVSALLSGFNYGILYIVLSTFSELWTSQYHQSVEISGLHYITCSLGELAGSQIGAALMDYLYKRRQPNKSTPESRIPLMFPAYIIAWLGTLAYGWMAAYRLHWFAVDVSVFIMMLGMQFGGMPSTFLLPLIPLSRIQPTPLVTPNLLMELLTLRITVMAYIIDAYGEHTSSVMASVQFYKSLMAFLFPLFAPSMYTGLGYGWGNSALALVGSLLTFSLSAFIWKYGARLRAKAQATD